VYGVIRGLDREKMLDKCEGKAVQIAQVAEEVTWSIKTMGWRDGSWIMGQQNLSRVLSAHGRRGKLCPRCEVEDLDGSLLAHLIESYKEDLMTGTIMLLKT
jgi:hypothetical protein